MYCVPAMKANVLDKQQAMIFIQLTMVDVDKKSRLPYQDDPLAQSLFSENEGIFPLEVVKRRIEVMKLPITFTTSALIAFTLLPDRVGGVVTMLIDLLMNFENKLVSMEEIALTYPSGFYSEPGLIERIEFFKADQTKPEDKRECKYSYVY